MRIRLMLLTILASASMGMAAGVDIDDYAAGMLSIGNAATAAASGYGGTVSNYAAGGTNWTAHIFTNQNTASVVFTVSNGSLTCEILMVAGGGAGGGVANNAASGAGAGGYWLTNGYSLAVGSYTGVVGKGGAGVTAADGQDGSNTTFYSWTVYGGGGGVVGDISGRNGGSGSGTGGSKSGGTATVAGQGNAGGGGVSYSGGGGISGVGGSTSGQGGAGRTNDMTGVSTCYAKGGAGGTHDNEGYAGGKGEYTVNANNGTAGINGTGGGGGGRWNNGSVAGYAGGSGIIVVRYPQP